jgi:hypothetical protein
MSTVANFEILGTSTTITRCGRCDQEAPWTVELDCLDDVGNATGRTVFYGVECAARAAEWTAIDTRVAARAAERFRTRRGTQKESIL